MSKARGIKTRKDRTPPPRAADAGRAPPGRGSSGARDGDEPSDDTSPPGRFGRTTTTGTAGGPKSG